MHVDTLLDRIQLKQRVRFWRICTVLVGVGAALVLARLAGGGASSDDFAASMQDHIARVKIEGVITDDPKQHELLDELHDDDRVKAVMLVIDSPGGTASGGEELYLHLREIAKDKPVVAMMRGMAASGGYMAALGADYVVAREGTITGSIGVILEAAEFTEMAKKLGIEPIVIKSGPYKAVPNPAEKFTPEQRASVQRVIDDFHAYFKRLTAERRKLPPEAVDKLAQGQIYSGGEAVRLKLVDALGGEDELLAWLAQEKKLDADMPILDAEVAKEEEDFLAKISALAIGKRATDMLLEPHGLMAIWR